jgi:carboxyl-terminal processing protease
MQSPSVDRAFHVSPGVGYVRVNSFDEKTGQELKAAIDKLGGANLRGLLLDLRDNPGGVLGSAVNAASLFLEPGTTLLSVRGRSVPREEIKVPEAAAPYSFRIAVLVNGKSASGSEIVAAAVQSHKRGVVVGQPTYGKGLVQAVMPLSAGTALALTTAYYYTPDGRSIQRQLSEGQLAGNGQAGAGGVQPDLIVWPERPTRLRAVLEATASFTNFATFYIQKHPAIAGNFEIDPKVLDEYQLFLSERNIRPGLDEWSQEREWIRSRLKQEILNQALGVEKGDELEIQRDPVVRRALEALA